ncbi:DEAD/DEAH box helicase [Pseudoroseomonas globiformis]|uniref:DEAD/DEAH box helicase n=1 Tax=Teichococcus globiformis TaxID=2307229 RepID=A0ABV7G590_9PROT
MPLSDPFEATATTAAETDLSITAGNPDATPEQGAALPDAVPEPAEEPAPRAVFADLGLSEALLRGVADTGYIHPTPIQEQAIPVVLMGRDVLGCAQTGTGKTASFVLPMMDILAGSRAKARMPRSLILEPTRELALQVAENFVKYGQHMKLNHALLIGGESMNDQRDALDKGVDVLIATPGRLLDLFERGRVMLADCKVLVIDEADRMLDMGFIPDVERIVSMLPPLRQTLFFSATMAPEIRKLADAFLQNPKQITVSAPASVATTITAGVTFVQPADKRRALRKLIRSQEVQNALIFCNRKRDVDILHKSLTKHGFAAGALHGDLPQSVRFATLEKFKAGELQLLVCSDVAARGIDIGGLSHVFNFDVPFRDEDYVHRIGRTGRAGREGNAFTLATADDVKLVGAIEALTGKPIPRIEIPGIDPVSAEELEEAAAAPKGGRGRGRSSAKDKPKGRREEREVERRGNRRQRDEAPRPTESRGEAESVVDEAPLAAPRDDRHHESRRPDDRRRPPRREESRRDEGRREESRRDDTRRRDRRDGGRDDLGPAVLGFGDSVPAFMLIPIPRPRRDPAEPIAEAAPAPGRPDDEGDDNS